MTFTLTRVPMDDGVKLAVYEWPLPSDPKALLQIAHGLAEHAGRYDRLAQALTQAGYGVFGSDHRGHGQTPERAIDKAFLAERDGFRRVVDDLATVQRHVAKKASGVPLVLLGHSFGSYLAQDFLFTHGGSLAGAVLSGTNAGVANLVRVGLAIAHLERRRVGPRATSKLLQLLSFGDFNRRFKPTRTDFDWLSRDAREVDKYLADPDCGFDFSVQGWIDLMGGLIRIDDPKQRARVPKSLPVYILAGAEDPVGRAGKGPKALAKAYRKAGLSDVTLTLYPNARHEMFNEINREEVTRDLITWLDVHVGHASNAARPRAVGG